MSKETFKVFIASSAEVKDEREKSILILNQINKSYPKLHIEPIQWEYDIPFGNYSGYDSIQKAINPLLKESQYILFILYSKLGAGTLEEFELAVQSKKKILVLFKEGFSPKNQEEITKYSELIKFKESIDDTILRIDYSNLINFELNLKDQFHLYLNKEYTSKSKIVNKQPSEDVTLLIRLLNEKTEELKNLNNNPRQLPLAELNLKFNQLEQEKQNIEKELGKNKELQEQLIQEKNELIEKLKPQTSKDELKKKALKAIEANQYEEAESLLIESTKDSISETASTFYELGKLHKLRFQYQKAKENFELAAKIAPENFDFIFEVGCIENTLGFSDNAIKYFENALKLDNTSKESLSLLNNELGIAYLNKGIYDNAIVYFKKSLDIQNEISKNNHPNYAMICNNLGLTYNYIGNYDKAISYFTNCLEMDMKFYGLEHPAIAIRYNNLGLAFENKLNYSKAIELYSKAFEINIKFYGNEHPVIVGNYNNLGSIYYQLNEFNFAIELLEKALDIGNKFYENGHPEIASIYNNLGSVYDSIKEFDLSIEYYLKALEMDFKYSGENNLIISNRYNNLGFAFHNKLEYKKAIEYFNKALEIYKINKIESHPNINLIEDNIKLSKSKLL